VPVQRTQDNNRVSLARIIPTNFEIEVAFLTNKYEGIDTSSVSGFARRWLFARRNGFLTYNINYGMTQLSISYTIADTLSIPQRESPADQESIYQVTGNVTVHGYVSEPVLGERGVINQIQLTATHPELPAGTQFFSF
jgi:hypothetical protein